MTLNKCPKYMTLNNLNLPNNKKKTKTAWCVGSGTRHNIRNKF